MCEKPLKAGQRCKLDSLTRVNKRAVQRRKNITSELMELRSQLPKVSDDKLRRRIWSMIATGRDLNK